MPAETRQPLRFYRLRCGRRVYGGWKATKEDAIRAGLPDRVTFEDPQDRRQLRMGPLAWLEVGERRYARSRTIVIGREG